MNQLKVFLLQCFAILLLSFMVNKVIADTQNMVEINYDNISDSLNVLANNVSLKHLLRKIARHSGIEVLFDDLVDEPVTLNIDSDSLEHALKQVLKGRNYSFRYSRDESGKALLIGVTVLPVGENNDKQARNVVSIENEAYYRGQSQLSLTQTQHMDMVEQRWQSRLSIIPPEKRDEMMGLVRSRLLEDAQFEQQQKKKQLQQKQHQKKYAVLRDQRREKALEGSSPEARAAFEKQGNIASEHMRRLIHGENN